MQEPLTFPGASPDIAKKRAPGTDAILGGSTGASSGNIINCICENAGVRDCPGVNGSIVVYVRRGRGGERRRRCGNSVRVL